MAPLIWQTQRVVLRGLRCDLCRQAVPVTSCCEHRIRTPQGLIDPIRYGDSREGWQKLELPPFERCPGCMVTVGMLHHPGCHLERCPLCTITPQLGPADPDVYSVQAISCVHCESRVVSDHGIAEQAAGLRVSLGQLLVDTGAFLQHWQDCDGCVNCVSGTLAIEEMRRTYERLQQCGL